MFIQYQHGIKSHKKAYKLTHANNKTHKSMMVPKYIYVNIYIYKLYKSGSFKFLIKLVVLIFQYYSFS